MPSSTTNYYGQTELAPFKIPKALLFREELPKTPRGKILKRDMRRIYRDLFTQ